jgi:hypothetical protein
MVTVQRGDTNYVYLLKGSGTQEFYRYNTVTGDWDAMAFPPLAPSGRPYKNGSCLTTGIPTEPDTTIWALKATYNEFYAYSVAGNAWTAKSTLPFIGTSGKKKKVKEGGSIAYHNRIVYALKGGNTNEFWGYQCDSNRWLQRPDMPAGGGKRVKGGGALTYAASRHALYALRGNNTLEFWKYGLSCIPSDGPLAGNGAMSDLSFRIPHSALRITPNPFTNATTINYSLPIAGNISLKLYDVTGTLVSTLASGYRAAGTSSFIVHRSSLSSGIYLLKLETETSTITQKLIIE